MTALAISERRALGANTMGVRASTAHYLIYVRRSYKTASAADVSDEMQEAIARGLLPPGSTCEVIRDSGGHNSGATDDRDGYQELIRRVREGGVAGIAVYDLSRLARNVRLMANLLHELERQQIAILAGNLPNTRLDSAVGRFMFHMLVSAAQFQRDLDSERMKAMMARTFEDGGHRGNDPFGYRTLKEDGLVVHPRTLVPVPEEAEVVRRVFRELASKPFSEVAVNLNVDHVGHRRPRAWTTNSIKDLWRRREVYRGNVTTRRGLETRPGRHDAILDEETYRDAAAGVERRKRQKGRRPRTCKRLYLLRSLVYCSCGARMRGDTRVSRGQEWRYYSCSVSDGRSARMDQDGQLVVCHARRVRADAAERMVVDALTQFQIPPEGMAAAREELRARLKAPKPGLADEQRSRLRTRIEKLAELYSWGDLTEAEYRKQRHEAEGLLAALPDNQKLLLFDRHQAVVASLPDAIAAADGDELQELIALLVERVETTNQKVAGIVWVAAARPFFRDGAVDCQRVEAGDKEDEVRGLVRPRTDSNRRRKP